MGQFAVKDPYRIGVNVCGKVEFSAKSWYFYAN
jgi:hypothetical protein